MLRVLHDQMLLAVLISGHDPGFALMHSGPSARPVHLVSRDFVLCEGEFADLQLATASESSNELDVVYGEK